jgi:hypothetical protein
LIERAVESQTVVHCVKGNLSRLLAAGATLMS